MNEYLQFALLGASLLYFWTVMFDRFSRSCAILAGVILVGCAGLALRPPEHDPFYQDITAIGFIGLLCARTWLVLKDLYFGK